MEREGFTVELRITYFCSGKYLQTKITNLFNGIIIKSWNGYFNNLLLWIRKSIFVNINKSKSKKAMKCKTTYFNIDSMNIK